LQLGADAARLLDGKQTLLAYLYRLMKEGLHRDAVVVLAHALPPRAAVWWAWHCARTDPDASSWAEAATALGATRAWLAAPCETRRQACGAPAVAAGLATPAGSAALAAFWSAANRTVPKSERRSPEAVAAAVLLAAHGCDRDAVAGRYTQLLREGIGVATGYRSATRQRRA
jgi:hypothetical protein